MFTKKLVVSTYLQYMLVALGALLLFTFTRQMGGVLLAFLLAAVLAYVLNPSGWRLDGRRTLRIVLVNGVFVALVGAILAALLAFIFPAMGQVQAMIRDPTALTEGATRLLVRMRDLPYVGEQVATIDQAALTEFARSNAPSGGQVLDGALDFIDGIFGVFGTVLKLLLMLTISIYILLNRERIASAVLHAVPGTIRVQIVEFFRTIESTPVKYLKAQLLLCVIMGIIGWAIVFFAFGKYAFLIGLWVGLTEVIPVLGPFLGATPAVVLALFAGSLTQALVVAALFLAAQQFEGNVLAPKIMDSSFGVHPLRVLFATLAATSLYGVVSAVFAVPIVTMIGAALRYLRETFLFEGKATVFRSALEEGERVEAMVLSEKVTGVWGSVRGEG